MNPVDIKMSIRAQRAKTFDLRRKVLLKNFFRNQNIFIHNATTAALESFDFSKHEQTNQDNGNCYTVNEGPSMISMATDRNNVLQSQETVPPQSNTDVNEPFVFTTMRVALPDSPTKPAVCSKADVGTDPPELETMINTVSSTSEILEPLYSKVKKKLSFKRHSFSKRKTSVKQKAKVVRNSRTKLNSLVFVKSPKRKRTSFRKRIRRMFKSSINVKKNSQSSSKDVCSSEELSSTKTDDESDYSGLIHSTTRSVATQTDTFLHDSYIKESENQRLRLENKHLKNKVQLLLKLNENQGILGGKYNEQASSLSKPFHDEFKSNQENKTNFNLNGRVTRSHSAHESSWEKELRFYNKQRYSRRTRSVCIPKRPEYENRKRFAHGVNQPFKPMQSFTCDDGRSRRKRRFTPSSINERSLDYHHTFPKRSRNFSLS